METSKLYTHLSGVFDSEPAQGGPTANEGTPGNREKKSLYNFGNSPRGISKQHVDRISEGCRRIRHRAHRDMERGRGWCPYVRES